MAATAGRRRTTKDLRSTFCEAVAADAIGAEADHDHGGGGRRHQEFLRRNKGSPSGEPRHDRVEGA